MKGEVPDGEILDNSALRNLRAGKDATIVALALMVPRALEAADILHREHGIDCEVIDLRSLVPLDTRTILASVAKTGHLYTVEENPRLCGWGAEIASIIATKPFMISTARSCASPRLMCRCPRRDNLEDIILPTPARIVDKICVR